MILPGSSFQNVAVAQLPAMSKALSQIKQPDPREKTLGFQALLRVNLEKGYQVLDTRLLAFHGLTAATPAAAQPSPSPSKEPVSTGYSCAETVPQGVITPEAHRR